MSAEPKQEPTTSTPEAPEAPAATLLGGTPTHVVHGNLTQDAPMYFSRQLALFDSTVTSKLNTEVCQVKPITEIKVHTITHLKNIIKEYPQVKNEFRRIRYQLSQKQKQQQKELDLAKSPKSIPSSTSLQQSPPQDASRTLFRPTYNRFVSDDEFAIVDNLRSPLSPSEAFAFHTAGPRETIMWKPGEVRACIVTCGGLCPGLNNVIQELFYCLHYNYGVDTIYGIRSGYRGFWQPQYQPWLRLTPEIVENIHEEGGSILGSSRGGFDSVKMVNALEVYGVNQVYVIGGDGTHRGAWELHCEATRRGIKMAVACVPKTIDNDIGVIDRSFGFNTAVAEARKAIHGASVSAQSTANSVAIVKLMGRHAGYIAAHATISARSVDACLIPEVPMNLHGSGGLLRHIQRITEQRGNAVIVVAEGAGDHWFDQEGLDVTYDTLSPHTPVSIDDAALQLAKETATASGQHHEASFDQSGNKVLQDVGSFLSDVVHKSVCVRGQAVNVIYTDPSYTIRSVCADAEDAVLSLYLATNAVHGAMAGYTGFSSATVNNRNVMIPIEVIVQSSPSYLNPKGSTWQTVLNVTNSRNEFLPYNL